MPKLRMKTQKHKGQKKGETALAVIKPEQPWLRNNNGKENWYVEEANA